MKRFGLVFFVFLLVFFSGSIVQLQADDRGEVYCYYDRKPDGSLEVTGISRLYMSYTASYYYEVELFAELTQSDPFGSLGHYSIHTNENVDHEIYAQAVPGQTYIMDASYQMIVYFSGSGYYYDYCDWIQYYFSPGYGPIWTWPCWIGDWIIQSTFLAAYLEAAVTIPCSEVRVSIGGLDRVPPTQPRQVAVTTNPSPLPTGCSISLVCETDANTVGSATVSPSNITQSTTVTITGGQQSWGQGTSAAPNNIKLKAKVGPSVLAQEAFTVCAHPTDFATSRRIDVNDIDLVGVVVNVTWGSDSGSVPHLNKTRRKEAVALSSTNNPPFTDTAGPMTGDWVPGDASQSTDYVLYRRAYIASGPPGDCIFSQLFEFDCERCGVTGAVCSKSGFKHQHNLRFDISDFKWKHKTTKSGSNVNVGQRSASAGSGSATSYDHTIPF